MSRKKSGASGIQTGHAPTAARHTAFQNQHKIEFGLKIHNIDVVTLAVESVRCQFCVYYGREESAPKAGEKQRKRQRKQTANVKYWDPPFRAELFRSHHVSQHPVRWESYQKLSYTEKVEFFELDKVKFKDTLHAHLGQKVDSLLFDIDAPIVDIIIGNMFFHPDDFGTSSHVNVMKLFKRNTTSYNDYTVTITNPMQFQLSVGFISAGLSFRQVDSVLDTTKRLTRLAVGCVNGLDVTNYARAVCAINLQAITSILSHESIWAFSLVNDASTHYGKSYLDNRIRFHLEGVLYNIHVLAIPMFDRHTGENMFNLVDKFLNIICPNWRGKLIGVGSDGANSMTGHLKGVVTRLEHEAVFKMYRIWCGLHQLDLVMHHAYEKLMDGEVLTILNAFVAHLRQQANLIADMQATCPKLSNRWVVMGKVCKWLLAKRIRLFQYITEAAPPQCPPFWWWIVIAAIDALTERVNIVFTKLQAKDLLVSQQTAELVNLASLICIQVRVDGPHSAEELDTLDTSTTFVSGRWSVSNYNIVRYFFLKLC